MIKSSYTDYLFIYLISNKSSMIEIHYIELIWSLPKFKVEASFGRQVN